MSEGFGGFVEKDDEDKEVKLRVDSREVEKLIKQYKKIKKYQKSSLYQVAKLSGKKTSVDKLIDEYGIDSEAIE